MTAELDKAIRAGCAQHTILRALDCNATKECEGLGCECGVAEVIAVALRFLAEPSEEAVQDMRLAMQEIEIPMKIDGSDRRWLARLPDAVSLAMARAAHAAYIRHILGDPDASS